MHIALAGVRDRDRQKQALGLILDTKLDIRETLGLLFGGRSPANLAVSQQFFRDHAAAIMKRAPSSETTSPLARMSGLFTATCRADQRDAIADYVKATFEQLPGGPRVVRQNLESMDQCIASRALLEPELRAWLEGLRPPKPKTDEKPGKDGKKSDGKSGKASKK
jgi:hypothetical protein